MGPGQRKFIGVVIGAVVSTALTNAFADWTGLRFWRPTLETSLPAFIYERRTAPYDVLFIGASRTRAAAHVATIDRVVGAGLGYPIRSFVIAPDVALFTTSLEVVETLALGRHTPGVIVMEIGPQGLNDNNHHYAWFFQTMASQRSILKYAHWIRSRSDIERALLGLQRGWANIAFVVAQARHWDSVRTLMFLLHERGGGRWPPTPDPDQPTWASRSAVQQEQAMERSVRHALSGDVSNMKVDGHNAWALRRMIALCEEHGIAVVLVEYPVQPEYAERVFVPEVYDPYERVMGEVCAHEGITCVRFTGSHALPLEARDFADAEHLSPWGAAKVSMELGREAIVPALKRGKH